MRLCEHERTAQVANSWNRAGSQTLLIVVLAGTLSPSVLALRANALADYLRARREQVRPEDRDREGLTEIQR